MWKTDFTGEITKLARPQGMWKTLWKTSHLWKKKTIE
jgi:hypothetical protein